MIISSYPLTSPPSAAVPQVRRGVTARDEYEKVAREIRFDAYKAALRGRSNEDCGDGDGKEREGGGGGVLPAVMFGHHEGDVEENVLTNLIKGCSILELAGERRGEERDDRSRRPCGGCGCALGSVVQELLCASIDVRR